jgi:hypothetical protein
MNHFFGKLTDGGFKKRGVLFAPGDALEEDPVVLKYAMGYVEKIEVLPEYGEYRVGDIRFSTSQVHRHRVETYGLNFKTSSRSISLIADTKFFPEPPNLYRGEILVKVRVFLKVILEPRGHCRDAQRRLASFRRCWRAGRGWVLKNHRPEERSDHYYGGKILLLRILRTSSNSAPISMTRW